MSDVDESTVPLADEFDDFDEAPPARKPSSRARSTIEWIAVVGGALIVAVIIRTFFLAAFYIPSPSMVPTLQVHDRVLVNKLSYDLHAIHRGDVVVFERPPGENDPKVKDLIKRVIGLPGDTLESIGGVVYVNGKPLTEPYLNPPGTTENLERQIVPAGMVFVMGDNRGNSHDSRSFGSIDEDLIVGRAFVIVWPLSHLGWL
jgi:signal peptidase I